MNEQQMVTELERTIDRLNELLFRAGEMGLSVKITGLIHAHAGGEFRTYTLQVNKQLFPLVAHRTTFLGSKEE